eukprot:CAMPEP_0177698342 /NCGR_PEP_ID=MMETSP0484_2-20121128/4991_1 /TAXON_ID=354590 /ORGANISM="Rhodomonas lens, Strain RHODO" /LENGTH=161 /DNA_ID=CAMNT_0019209431 /DNA_START=208 /DNA_END=690 /DNA_ORIENTATION=+
MAARCSRQTGWLLSLLLCSFAMAALGFQPTCISSSPRAPLLQRSQQISRPLLAGLSLRPKAKTPCMVASSPRPTETLAAGENRKLTSADLPSLYDSVGKFDFEKAYPGGLENIHGLWDVMSQVCPDHIALADHLHEGRTPRELSFAEAARRIEVLAGGLQQ